MYLGDFFDRPDLTAEEITALKEIKWNQKKHYFLLGNHEMYDSVYASLYSISLDTQYSIMSTPCEYDGFFFLPYIKEHHKSLIEYFPELDSDSIVFSHNDIKGFQYGLYKSEVGIDLQDINSNCGLFVNGHLHNCGHLGNLINVGNLTGLNFSENAEIYKHHILVLDTDNKHIDYINNPFAFNFYKFDFTVNKDIPILDNAVISGKCFYEDAEEIKKKLNEHYVVYRLNVVLKETDGDKISEVKRDSDPVSLFKDFIRSNNIEAPTELLSKIFEGKE